MGSKEKFVPFGNVFPQQVTYGLPIGSFDLRNLSILCLALLLFFSVSQFGYSHGIGWSIPKGHFDGVDNQGNVLLVFGLGEIELAQGRQLPFFAVFNSESENRSPFAGYGWNIPLVDSRIVQMDENLFCVFQPDGFQRIFRRDKEKVNILNSFGGWSAKIHGDTITAYCKYGDKLVFREGHIVSMELDCGKLDYVYEDGQLLKILQGDKTVLKIEKESRTGTVSGFALSKGQNFKIDKVQRPKVRVSNNRNLLDGMEESLGKIKQNDGTVWAFEYGTDKKLDPTLKIQAPEIPSNREIVWDGATRKAIRDGEWTYDIKPGSKPETNAEITRININNQKEYWYRDEYKGEEISEGVEGVRKVASWFTSGKLMGKMRKEVEIKNGVTKLLYECSYNEKGILIRLRKGLQDTFFIYEEDGRLAALVRNGVIIRKYTDNGALLAKKFVE